MADIKIEDEPKSFNDIFEIVECLDENILCKLTSKKTLFEARKMYIDKMEGKICEDGWVIDDDRIGEISGNADIFPSKCKNNDKIYAAKFIKLVRLLDLKSVMNEILIQNKLYSRCKSVTIPIYQAFIDKNNTYAILIMDLIKGMTVRRYITDAIRNPDHINNIIEIVSHCKKLIKFLFYKCLIIHGDSHLNNFMINPIDSTIKIIDFGNSREIVPLTKKEFDLFRIRPEFFIKQLEQPIKNDTEKYKKDLSTIDSYILVHIKHDVDVLKHIIDASNKNLDLYNPSNDPPILNL